ncbi:MAG TPA: Crp/Fnr family transcriptional regulator [Kaistella chaponensis]|jgi:CRP/FNR family transcriptional regulator|uniref:CRP/FNR family transcriptional regulator, anaerobic regulatory protein n=1 Tax=Kaistella chaponensis TaxID=713588 RepID=A0A1N7LS55_9FLAO|nr:Crp/Fnr family transcriptional regulator [Kaistella chaponensis]SIS76602.1 CRP/FNR family transcriptional regulator, anaerobic regulatory protein [Kaistella chaponensis]HPW89656.1 Crp/Fnr family transcriptional regulator [Kaistella chaponensis]HQC05924.1 Crp/Fnr family transcriptional regulator [Kaistella chaponensis]
MNLKDIFQSDLVKEIENSGNLKHFEAGDTIVNMDSYIKHIPVVISGSMKVIRTEEDGREILLYYLTPGESCIVSILAGMKNETSKIKAIVEEDAEIMLIPADKAKEWVRKYPEWTDFIFNLYQKRFEELLEVVNSVAFQKIDTRLLHLIKQKTQLYQSKEISVTHQQLADELGITREATSRVLKQMEKENLLILSRNKIELL